MFRHDLFKLHEVLGFHDHDHGRYFGGDTNNRVRVSFAVAKEINSASSAANTTAAKMSKLPNMISIMVSRLIFSNCVWGVRESLWRLFSGNQHKLIFQKLSPTQIRPVIAQRIDEEGVSSSVESLYQ